MTFAQAYIRRYTCIHTHTYEDTYTRIHTKIHTHAYIRRYIHTHTYEDTHASTQTLTRTHTYTHSYMHVHTHTYTHTHTRTHTHAHTHTRTHTHIHTHTHTQLEELEPLDVSYGNSTKPQPPRAENMDKHSVVKDIASDEGRTTEGRTTEGRTTEGRTTEGRTTEGPSPLKQRQLQARAPMHRNVTKQRKDEDALPSREADGMSNGHASTPQPNTSTVISTPNTSYAPSHPLLLSQESTASSISSMSDLDPDYILTGPLETAEESGDAGQVCACACVCVCMCVCVRVCVCACVCVRVWCL